MATYQELLAQRDALDKQIEDARKAELSNAIKQVKAIILEYKLTSAQCGFSGVEQSVATKSTKPVAVYYRTPDGTEWSGRGRTPVPIQALVNAGHKIEEFLTEEGKVWFDKKNKIETKKANK
jgi:DNA-binding protein H-NS